VRGEAEVAARDKEAVALWRANKAAVKSEERSRDSAAARKQHGDLALRRAVRVSKLLSDMQLEMTSSAAGSADLRLRSGAGSRSGLPDHACHVILHTLHLCLLIKLASHD